MDAKIKEILEKEIAQTNGQHSNLFEEFNELIFDVCTSNPKIFKTDSIRSVGETAYQRAIYNGEFSELEDSVIQWLDGEIPVDINNASRRKCLDLIGKQIETNKLVLCELKYAKENKDKKDSPLYALIELLFYLDLIKKNSKNLPIGHEVTRVEKWEWSDINSSTILIIAGNKNYWTYWRNKKTWFRDKIYTLDNLKKTLKQLSDLDIRLYETENENFESQLNFKDSFRPVLENGNKWKRIDL